MPRCDRCRYFHPHPPAAEPGCVVVSGESIRGGGECRANPPVVIQGQLFGRFPVVWNDGWCGAFELRHEGETETERQ